MSITIAQDWSTERYAKGTSAFRSYTVGGASTQEDALNALASSYSIYRNAPHPLDPRLRIVADGLAVTPAVPGGGLWRVEANWALGTFNDANDPLLQKPTYKWMTGATSEQIDRDYFGSPIVNSVGDVPNPKPTRLITSLMLMVSKNERFFDVERYFKFANKINGDAFQIQGKTVQPGQAFCHPMEQAQESPYDADFVRIVYKIEFRAGIRTSGSPAIWDGFMIKFVDKGRRAYFAPSGGGDAVVQDLYTKNDLGDKVKVSEDVNLAYGSPIKADYMSKNGAAGVAKSSLPRGASISFADDNSASFLTYQNYDSATFAQLGIF